jgi:hypothetical protein
VVLEPQTVPKPAPAGPAEVIENEIPAYRAIHRLAVFSLIFGVLSIFCFADYWFLICAALAVIAGALAERKIRQYSDVYTGRGLAQAGIAMGLIFSVAAGTTYATLRIILNRDANGFARVYLKVLQGGRLADAMWYHAPPQGRRAMNPEEILKKMYQGASKNPMTEEAKFGPTRKVLDILTKSNGKIRFAGIEGSGYENLERFAFALYELDWPNAPSDHPEVHFALADIRSDHATGDKGWWVREFYYPYKPASHRFTPKPIDVEGSPGHHH